MLLPVLTLLISCQEEKVSPQSTQTEVNPADTTSTDTTTDIATPDDTGDTGDTGDTEPVIPDEEPVVFWTDGPDLPECTEQQVESNQVALSGVLLTLDGPVAGTVVYDKNSGVIQCVGDCDTGQSTVICTEGVISPGLIDGHNHMQYNALAPWQHGKVYENRYQWRSDGDYWDYREAYDGIEGSYLCEIGLWSELRTMAGGGSSVVGSSGGSCIAGWVRNLDEASVAHGLNNYDLYYSASTVTTRWDEGDGERYSNDISSGDLQACMNHVAEGVKGTSKAEIDHMFDIGMAGPGMVFVHSTDANVEQLARMATEGTTILWSPRSNLDLYQATTHADIAMKMGVPVALGPDWTWSGSANPARELRCAKEYLLSRRWGKMDHDLWAMATSDAARAVGLDGILGSLEPGMIADIAVFSYSSTPYQPVIDADPRDIRLMVINGKALYGTSAIMNSLHTDTSLCETVSACDEERMFCLRDNQSDDGYFSLQNTLETALSQEEMPEELAYAKELFGVWMCEDIRKSCDVSITTDDDSDGDGIADVDDVCVYGYDPLQGDHDKDGVGDVCDPCPLLPNGTECAHDPADIDGDGIATNEDICPWHHDPNQDDSDGDGKGDACELCPDYPNPGDSGCMLSIEAIRNPNAANHPPEGSDVIIQDAIVTAFRPGVGFYVQDAEASEYGGLFVYSPNATLLEPGTVVEVEGTYVEYYGLTQITASNTTATGSASVPDPIIISSSCDVATGGNLAEQYEGMIVQVSNVSVSNDNPDGPDNNYSEFEVDGCLRIDDLICEGDCWAEGVQPAVGTTYTTITAIHTYTYGHHKLAPRTPADMQQ